MRRPLPTSRYEYAFDPEATNNTAASIYRLARDAGPRVLDVGSGPGLVSGAIAAAADKHVTCLDIDGDHLRVATERGVQRTVQADLSHPDWAAELDGDRFDVIIFADVLEHMVDPGAVLDTVRRLNLLSDGGELIVSIPNASHISILAVLAVGDFPYRPTGLLDETHLRFFTLRSMRRLLEVHGFGIDEIHRTTKELADSELFDAASMLDPELHQRLRQQHEETDTYQYVLKVSVLGHQPVSVQQSELEDLRKKLRGARRKRSEAEAELSRLQRQSDQAAKEHDTLRAEVARLDRALGELYRSRTWRAGRGLVGGPAAIKRALRRG